MLKFEVPNWHLKMATPSAVHYWPNNVQDYRIFRMNKISPSR